MSLFDSITNLATNFLGGALEDKLPGLLQGALGQTELGNLSGLLDRLRDGGLGEQVASWLSGGPNLPISPDQISRALGDGQLAEIAGQFGLSPDIVANALANYLPGLVDKLSPNGILESQ